MYCVTYPIKKYNLKMNKNVLIQILRREVKAEYFRKKISYLKVDHLNAKMFQEGFFVSLFFTTQINSTGDFSFPKRYVI